MRALSSHLFKFEPMRVVIRMTCRFLELRSRLTLVIVTGDKDLLSLKTFDTIRILSPREFYSEFFAELSDA
ncbi:MAG TPA: hypothetical protein PK402_03925 [Tepidisphaeraceae bacterium]|nr:hypothetical protein [Tepidisphaeraceae bacterium]